VRDGYYSVLCGLFEEAPRSLLSLPAPTYSMLLASLKYALLSYGSSPPPQAHHRTRTTAHTALLTCVGAVRRTDTDVARRGLETLCSVCTHHYHARTHNSLPSAPSQPLPAEAYAHHHHRTCTTTARHARVCPW
jgi:hypothetical protein